MRREHRPDNVILECRAAITRRSDNTSQEPVASTTVKIRPCVCVCFYFFCFAHPHARSDRRRWRAKVTVEMLTPRQVTCTSISISRSSSSRNKGYGANKMESRVRMGTGRPITGVRDLGGYLGEQPNRIGSEQQSSKCVIPREQTKFDKLSKMDPSPANYVTWRSDRRLDQSQRVMLYSIRLSPPAQPLPPFSSTCRWPPIPLHAGSTLETPTTNSRELLRQA